MTNGIRTLESKRLPARVYCPICTRAVEAEVVLGRRSAVVRPGQKCPRCSSSLDAGVVLRLQEAA